MPQQEQQTQRQQSKKKRQSNIKNKKKRIPFIPNSPSSVGSPSIGALINQRRVRQLSPQHLCSLVLPPPLRSFFDTDGSVVPHGADDHPILLDHHARQSASNISISGASTSTHHNTRLPPHVRVGFAKCDPLLVFDGKYVLVATADGRIAIYSILEFDSDVSQDIKMSERRRRKEWADDDSLSLHQVTATPKEEKKFGPIGHECNLSNELEEEENEWEIRETMNKKEKARLIEPLLVVCLPNRIGSEGEQGNDSLLSPSTIVAICATPKKGISLVEQRNATYSTIPFPGDDFLGHVAVLTSVGDIHVLEFATSDTSKAISESNGADGGTYAADHPNVTIILSFDTESSGATSICMRPAGNQSGSLVRLCVGFESGLLHEFQLYATSFQRSSELEKPSTPRRQRSHEIKTSMRSDTIPLKRQTSDHGRQSIAGPSTVKVSLCWQGFIDTPIRSLSCTGWGGVGPQLLVVGTEYRQYANAKRDSGTPLLNHLSPAISLDMINASLAESMWRKMKYEGDTSNIKAKSKGIPLCDCSVWPAAGMEIKDGFIHSSTKMVPGAKHKPLSTIDLQRVSTTSKLCCFEESQHCFASAASDGTIAISHCLEDGTWGITDENNQVLFCQKCVGLGTIERRKVRYVACCLRGGTIYMVPVVESSKSRKDIVMFATPVDSTDFGAVRCVQNFAAGVVQVKELKDRSREESSSSMKSTALVGWSGGRIDVYEINVGQERDNLLLEKIAERGTLSKVVEMMMKMDKSHPQLQSSALWKQAWDECQNANEVETVVSSVRNPNDDSFEAMSSLLRCMMRQDVKM